MDINIKYIINHMEIKCMNTNILNRTLRFIYNYIFKFDLLLVGFICALKAFKVRPRTRQSSHSLNN